MTATRRALLTTPAALALAALTACGPATPAPIAWRLDDLGQDPQTGRYFSTCENPANPNHELETWLTEEQAAEHTEGGDCPTGDIRTPEYYQQGDEADLDRKRPSASKPTKPTTSGGTRSGSTTSTRSSTSGTTSGGTRSGSTTGTRSGTTDTRSGTTSGSTRTGR